MMKDANDPDTQELFRRFLDGRKPRRFEDVQERLARELIPAPTKWRLPRRAGLVSARLGGVGRGSPCRCSHDRQQRL